MLYKTVMVRDAFIAPSIYELERCTERLTNIINKEANGGWEFYDMYEMSARVNHKVASGLGARMMGKLADEDGTYTVQVAVFRKY